MSEKRDTHHRALDVNLDTKFFGTFAEIGAGQEVARWFLQVGGAAGTVAKTISAYDMKFSDEIYGKGSRYVSRERLLAMLDHEYDLLLERLDDTRGDDTKFFAFADTVAARNFSGTNRCNGWMGVRFQTSPRSEPSECLMHVNMLDDSNLRQQQALGILGVNAVYSARFVRNDLDDFLASLMQGLNLNRIEIDVVELHGPAFADIEPYTLGTKLVTEGLAQAVLFDADSSLVQPSTLLRKRPLVVERGMFQTTLPFHSKMLAESVTQLKNEVTSKRDPISIPELTVRPVSGREIPDVDETLRRLNKLSGLGHPILLSRYPEAYHLTQYLRRYTKEPLRFVYGISTLIQFFHEAHYGDLMGGLLEAFGGLLANGVRLFAYPMDSAAFHDALIRVDGPSVAVSAPPDGYVTVDTIELEPPIQFLFHYLRSSGWIVGLKPPQD